MAVFTFIWNNLIHAPIVNILILSLYYTKNLAFSITILVSIVQIVLIPLSIKRYKYMQKMADLYPKLKKLTQRYRKQPRLLRKKQAELYKKYGIRGYSNWITFIITIPVLVALYQVVNKLTSPTGITELSSQVYPFINNIIPTTTIKFSTNLWHINLVAKANTVLIGIYIITSAALNILVYHFYNYLPKETAIQEIMEQFGAMPHSNKEELRTFATSFYYTRYLQFLIVPIIVASLLKNYPGVLIFYFIVNNIIQFIINGLLYLITKGGVKLPNPH